MSHARKAALHLLNNDWSRGVWKHWLSNVFLPPVEPPMPSAPSAPPPSAPSTAPAQDAAPLTGAAVSKLESCSRARSEPPGPSTSRDVRRAELRARFEALSDRLMAVEDGLDTLLRRAAQRDKSDRRSDLQNVEVIDNVAVAAERQAAVLEGLLNTVSRLEHAVARLDSGLSRVERALGERNRRDSHAPSLSQPPQRLSPSQFPESHLAPRPHRSAEADDADGSEVSGINGYLSDVSLSTVLAMLELERHTGRLKVATDDGMLASFELCEGSVVRSRLCENDTDPLQTLRSALRWKQGRFWFRQQPAEPQSVAPRSIGSLLLEATRQNDESFADVG